jgi:cell division septal protein FtsQ
MKRIKAKHRPQFRFTKILLSLPVLIISVFAWNQSDRVFYARYIECYTQFGTCPDQITTNISWLKNYPLLKPLPVSKIRQQFQQNLEIKSISLYRRLPQTLVLSIALRKPIGVIGPAVLGTHVIADEEGVIIGQTDKSNLPLLMDNITTHVGDKLDGSKLQALKILGQIGQISPSLVIGKITNTQLTAYLPEDTRVLIDLSSLPSGWYTTLQVILDRSKILSKIPKVIDLRFSSPTITF